MDSRTLFIQENLNGYNLPADSLSDIRGVLMKRFGAKFSEGLSPEGRLAMEQAARKEAESAKSLNRIKQSPGSAKRDKSRKSDHSGKKAKTITFTETHDKTSSDRLDRDITDDHVDEVGLKGNAVGGENDNALEAVENITPNEVEYNTAVMDNTKIQSVEKCLVWMEAHNEMPGTGVHDFAQSRDNSIVQNDIEKL